MCRQPSLETIHSLSQKQASRVEAGMTASSDGPDRPLLGAKAPKLPFDHQCKIRSLNGSFVGPICRSACRGTLGITDVPYSDIEAAAYARTNPLSNGSSDYF